jgi:hypothetical protein
MGLEFLRTLNTETVILGTRLKLPFICSYNRKGFQSTTALIKFKSAFEDSGRNIFGGHSELLWHSGRMSITAQNLTAYFENFEQNLFSLLSILDHTTFVPCECFCYDDVLSISTRAWTYFQNHFHRVYMYPLFMRTTFHKETWFMLK